jgi:tetratricopeptide (TPR) repeat protein
MRTIALLLLAAFLSAEAPPDIDRTWDWDHPDRSEARFRELLRRQDLDESYRLELQTQIARCQGMQNHPAEAEKTLAEVATQEAKAKPAVKIRRLLELGRLRRDAGKADEAAALFKEALSAADQAGSDMLALDALHMLAIADAAHAVDWTQQAIARIEKSQDRHLRGWLGPLYHNLAEAYAVKGDYAHAREWHAKDLQWRLDTHAPADDVRWAKLGVAQAQRHLGQVDEALAQQRALLDECAKDGVTDPWELGLVHSELGECLLAQGKKDEAQPHVAKAWELLKGELEHPEDEQDRRLKARLQELNGAKP